MPIPTSQKKPFIPAPGVAQIEMIYSYLGQKVENVYHVKVPGGAVDATADQLTSLAGLFIDWEHNHGAQMRNAGVQLTLVRARALGSQAGNVIELNPTVAVTGTAAGAGSPGNVTVALKWSTALGGRSFRGRTYHIGINAQSVTGNQVTTGYAAFAVTQYTALMTAINTSPGYAMVVLSYAHNKLWRDEAVATPIQACSMDINLDSQRRRLTGRGT